MSLVQVWYDNLYDAVREGQKAEEHWRGRVSATIASRRGDTEGTSGRMTKTWEEAEALALNGWDEGVSKLVDLRDQLMEEIGRALPEPRVMMDVSGFDVDVGAYVAGMPENMLTTWEMDGNKRTMHIVYNGAVPWNVTPEAMMLRGLLVAGLVDTLEHLGHRVRLDVVFLVNAYYDDSDKMALIYNLKRERDVLDVERMVFACAHPSMFRRIGFANMEMRDYATAELFGVPTGGYGTAGGREILPEGERGDIYIGTTKRPGSLADVTREVLGYLRESGILDEEEE